MQDKTYNCKKCKTKHAPPTGKNYQVNNEPSLSDMLAAIKGIQSQMDAVVDRVSNLEATSDQGDAEVDSAPGSVDDDQPQEPRLQAKVKARMAELNLMPDTGPVDTADHATLLATPGGTARGTKSGRAQTADDTVSNDVLTGPIFTCIRELRDGPPSTKISTSRSSYLDTCNVY